jgi:NitT/TauT family transport system substrate-binding protein
VLAYGAVIKNPTDPARFMDTSFLDALAKRSPFAQQQIAIAPIRTSTQASLEGDPGSTVLLRGHVDNARVNEFKQQGGEQLVQSMALKAMELSRQRAMAVSDALLAKFPDLDKSRVEAVGRGWEEPGGADSALNRRVEVQWFTIE